MDWRPLWEDGPVIATHALVAIFAIVAATVQMALPKGKGPHRVLGYVWLAAMALVALWSFWIHEFRVIGPFSPIHILSAITLVTLVYSLRAARRGNIAAHRASMTSLYVFALLITGAFTLLPGRTMHAVIFGG